MTDSTKKEVLTTEQAATYLNVSESSLKQYRAEGKGPPYAKLEGSVRYRLSDLREWVANRVVDPTGSPDDLEGQP